VTDGQQLAEPCPQCGNSAEVHSIGELAALAQAQLNQAGQGFGSASPQQGWEAEPQAGPPQPGWARQPQAGPPSGSWLGRGRDYYGTSVGDGIGDAVADAALGAVGGFIGKAIGRRVQKAMTERVMPTLAANRETMLRQQIDIAQRHPDLRACLTDKVVFLAGGVRVLPMPNLMTVTADQADAIVAQLRNG
jgi:hypothetical protein